MGNIDSIVSYIDKSNIIKTYETRLKAIKNMTINNTARGLFKDTYVKKLIKSKNLLNNNSKVYTDKIDNVEDYALTDTELQKLKYDLLVNIKTKFDNYFPSDDMRYGSINYFIVNKFMESIINIKIFSNILKFEDPIISDSGISYSGRKQTYKNVPISNFRKQGRHYFVLFSIHIDDKTLICPAIHEDEGASTLLIEEFSEKVDFMGVNDDSIVQAIENPKNNYKTIFKVDNNIIGGIDFTILKSGVDLCTLYKNKIKDFISYDSNCKNIDEMIIELNKNGIHMRKTDYSAEIFTDLNTYIDHLNNLYKQIKNNYRPDDISNISILSTSF